MAPLHLASVALLALLASLSTTNAAIASNHGTSLTLLYQNNLNASDDANHVGAILLDPTTVANASTACAAIGENLISWATIQTHMSDFKLQLSYQAFAGYQARTQRYFISDNVISVTLKQDSETLITVPFPNPDTALPVLCTQSSHENGPGNANATDSNLLSVASGGNTYIGFRNQKSFRFLGIPYVAQPDRFAYSTYPSPNTDGFTIFATNYGKPCSQASVAPGATSENCLFLNIQTPFIPKSGSNGTNLRPVHFWIHGGGFVNGAGSGAGSDGGNLASREDIVTVTINYRLSTLGFLAIPGSDIKGNMGIGDQINALRWTIDNIANFGGDPTQITINGESAGAGSVRALLGSPPAKGLYKGAIAMSNLGGGIGLGPSLEYANTYSDYLTVEQSYDAAGQGIFTGLNCTNATLADQIACLKTIDANVIVNFHVVARFVVQDGNIINSERLDVSNKNGSTAFVDVMFGITANDGGSWTYYSRPPATSLLEGIQRGLGISPVTAQGIVDSGLFPSFNSGDVTADSFNISQRVATDIMFRCIDQATVFAGVAVGAFKSAYFYQMERTYTSFLGLPPVEPGFPNGDPNLPYYRLHGSDIPNAFGNLNIYRDANDLYAIQLISGYFAEFMKRGSPNIPIQYLQVRGYSDTLKAITESDSWGAVQNATGPMMRLDYPSKKSGFIDLPQCVFLKYPIDYYLRS